MNQLTRPKVREIIDDFVREIESSKRPGPVPTTTVINFRNEAKIGKERKVYFVPIDRLRYRKDNGRITSDVLDYQKNHGLLDEKTEGTQNLIRDFLKRKDPEKTQELKRIIKHEDQREAAIITCDGFLINGNRRRTVLESLLEDSPGTEEFKTMKAVILPGKDDEGGPPTLKEIEEIENRYQLQGEGKAEYSGFDRALSMRRKIQAGMSLEEQLRDDPSYAEHDKKEMRREIKKFENDFLEPLECVDRYLSYLDRDGLYRTISSGLKDREGRWQAFIDYYKSVRKNIVDPKKRIMIGIDENEIGDIEDVAFKIIRKQLFPHFIKVHEIMRRFPELLRNKDSKKELLTLLDIDLRLPEKERVDENGKEYDERELDRFWGEKYGTEIIRQVRKATLNLQYQEDREEPLDLLKQALKKLKHKNMIPESVNCEDISKAMKLTQEIQKSARELERQFYQYQKKTRELSQKFKK